MHAACHLAVELERTRASTVFGASFGAAARTSSSARTATRLEPRAREDAVRLSHRAKPIELQLPAEVGAHLQVAIVDELAAAVSAWHCARAV